MNNKVYGAMITSNTANTLTWRNNTLTKEPVCKQQLSFTVKEGKEEDEGNLVHTKETNPDKKF